jgi:hypothetical protein
VTGVALKGYAVVGGTGAPPIVARLREATDKATTKLKGMRQRGLRHSLWLFLLTAYEPQILPFDLERINQVSAGDELAYDKWPSIGSLHVTIHM